MKKWFKLEYQYKKLHKWTIEEEDVLKHEWVHVKQIEQDRLYSCSHKILRRMNEIEAYFMEDVPNPIYNLIYGEPEI